MEPDPHPALLSEYMPYAVCAICAPKRRSAKSTGLLATLQPVVGYAEQCGTRQDHAHGHQPEHI